MKKRALCGAIILAVTLSFVGAPAASAADAPQKDLTTVWTAIETWIQGFLAGWFGSEPLESAYAAQQQCLPNDLGCADSQDDGGGGTSTTDGGPVGDPDG